MEKWNSSFCHSNHGKIAAIAIYFWGHRPQKVPQRDYEHKQAKAQPPPWVPHQICQVNIRHDPRGVWLCWVWAVLQDLQGQEVFNFTKKRVGYTSVPRGSKKSWKHPGHHKENCYQGLRPLYIIKPLLQRKKKIKHCSHLYIL